MGRLKISLCILELSKWVGEKRMEERGKVVRGSVEGLKEER